MESGREPLREPLLLGTVDGGGGDVVRVALNPSVLDRFLRGNRYYFYDDVPVPHEGILRGAGPRLLPSQKARLLRGHGEDCAEGEVFGHLWLLLCARLAAARADYFRREAPRLYLLGAVGSLAVLVLTMIVATGADGSSAVAVAILAVANSWLLTARFADAPVSRRDAQDAVDEVGPHFAPEGFRVDLVDASPTCVRIERVGAGGGPRVPLGESMARFQERARRKHQDAALDRRQARLREHGAGAVWILGVPAETLAEWKTTIAGLTAVLGVVYLASMVMTFLGASVFWALRAGSVSRVYHLVDD